MLMFDLLYMYLWNSARVTTESEIHSAKPGSVPDPAGRVYTAPQTS